jgi:two-component system NarL family response regulator
MLVDDHKLVREGIRSLITHDPDVEVVAEVADGAEAISQYAQIRPDVTLMDLKMPKVGGADAITAIKREIPSARMIVLTTYADDDDVYRAIKAGAEGYLLKDVATEELLRAIKAVHRGKNVIPADLLERVTKYSRKSPLTERETEVLKLMVEGKANRDIGKAMQISENTVKVHSMHIFEKLDVTSRTQAVLLALAHGWFKVP